MANVQGAAIGTDRRTMVQTTDVSNSIKGTKELMVTYTNSTASAQPLTIKSGAHRATVSATAGASAFASPGFADNTEMQAYFKGVATVMEGLRIYSDDPSNFDGYFQFQEKEPDGTDSVPVKFYLQKYKQPLGGGTYANEIFIPISDLSINVWAGLEWTFSSLKANSALTIYAPVKGWDKVTRLSPLKTASIG